MRYRDILLEYDRQKTLARLGKRAYQRFINQMGTPYGTEIANKAKDHVGCKHNAFTVAFYEAMPEFLIREFENYDPTPNKEYVQWMLERYISQGIALVDDLGKVRASLRVFQGLKAGGYFKRNPEDAKLADIGQFKTLGELMDFVERAVPGATSGAELDRRAKADAIETSDILYDDAEFTIVIPKSVEAAQYWGRNTRWCTSALTDNAFDNYNEGPLYIIVDKLNNRRWQFYFEGYHPQFMDERDARIEWEEFPEVIWTLFDWPKDTFGAKMLTTVSRVRSGMKTILLETFDHAELVVASFYFKEPKERKILQPYLDRAISAIPKPKVTKVSGATLESQSMADLCLRVMEEEPNSDFLPSLDRQFWHLYHGMMVKTCGDFAHLLRKGKGVKVSYDHKTYYCRWGGFDRGSGSTSTGLSAFTEDLRPGIMIDKVPVGDGYEMRAIQATNFGTARAVNKAQQAIWSAVWDLSLNQKIS